MPRICDYEGSQYRTEFWENENRAYEDGVERVALQKMLPSIGQRLIEIGAGFGRLADLYTGYQQVVLLDYARTQVEEARRYVGDDSRYIYVVGDIYSLPFVDNLFDALTMIRVMHHLTDVQAALGELQRILRNEGTALIEYANRRNIKAIARWLVRRQPWSPFGREPLEFVELNFNFHPHWMHEQFAEAGFERQHIRTLSHYRIWLLKKYLPTNLLITLDKWVQPTGDYWQLTPSVLIQAQAKKPDEAVRGFLCCPQCKQANLYLSETADGPVFICHGCQVGWSYFDGIYDFKTPIVL